MKATMFLLFAFLYVAGCGQKGPLFLPGNTNEISTSIPQQSSPDNEEDEDDDEKPVTNNY
jgi:predicted small lipoprotein YifL